MSWGISENANKKEKLKAEMTDYLNGLNSVGKIDYKTYSELIDFSMNLLDEMYNLGLEDMEYIEDTPPKYNYFKKD